MKSAGRFFFGVEAHYNLKGKTTLTDPSDQDSVRINTYAALSGLGVAGYNFLSGQKARLFVNAGAGIAHALGVKTRVYTSKFGYETKIEPPEDRDPFVVFAGLGFVWNFSSSAGLLINGRY